MSFAAAGEDTWMLSEFPRDYIGYAVEVGANDGLNGSNTMGLEHAGWTVLCVEPIPAYEPSLKEYRTLYKMCAAGSEDKDGVAFHVHDASPAEYSSLNPGNWGPIWKPAPDASFSTISVSVRKLDTLLDEVGFPRLDALSIDTEGTELDVLKGLTFAQWRPKVIVVESWDEPSEASIYLMDMGYKKAGRRAVNDLFLDERFT